MDEQTAGDVRLHWKPSVSASIFHALEVWLQSEGQRPLGWAEPLRPTMELLWRGIGGDSHFMNRSLIRQLAERAAQYPSARTLAEAVLMRLMPREEAQATAQRLTIPLNTLFREGQAALADAEASLQAATAWLKAQWLPWGPIWLRRMELLTEPELLVEEATVIVLAPLPAGPHGPGGGRAHLRTNAAAIEAATADPHADLPERLRLAWMISQLNLDLPTQGGEIPQNRLSAVAGLALLPAVLMAAHEGQAPLPPAEALARPITLWLPNVPDASAVAEKLAHWWRIYWDRPDGNRPPLGLALAGLNVLLAEVALED